ncbi:MAG: hypothetical protein N4A31_07350, partial [Rickettsiales bacterium]|nr:hypothetical protein [Rickettsiales bacterium]
MSLTYIEKLKIFHDNFVKYTWNYIERQKAMENGQEVPAMTTPFKDNLTPLKVLPIVKDTVEVVSWLNDIWNGHLHHITSINVNRLFALSDKMTQQMLSRAIQEVAIHIEDHLNTLRTPQEIGAFATTAMIKFISYIRSNHYNDIETLTSNDIIFAILQQKLFSNDVFKVKIIGQSDNYYFIYEKEIRNDINAGKIDSVKQALVPVSIEFDYSMEEISIISSISADNAVSLCEYIRMNNKISPNKQIVIIQDSVQKDHMFPRYTIISPSVIDSEIDSLRIDDLEDMVANNQDNIGKQEAMLLRYGIILDEHEELFQQMKQLYLQSLQEYSISS